MDFLIPALQGGAASLAAYLAAHVLLCLVPAFFIAGALSALVPQAAITRYLGPEAPRWVAYPAAAGAGSLLAVCSCTVQPLFAGIYSKGAGLGPAITFSSSRPPPTSSPCPTPALRSAPRSPLRASCSRSPSASASA
jgi:uncharacterized membrane protein YraQ (UPF0718 family)